jgi:small subunit ribosomal protein S1
MKEQEKALKGFVAGLKVGDQLAGKVTRLMPYGAFVELFPGLEGMVHLSELSWSRVEKTGDVISPNAPVTVKVIGIGPGVKPGSLKISLSLKQVTGDPWEGVRDKFRVGERVNGKVTRCTDFGAFVEIVPGIEGLVHLSEMSYMKRVIKAEEVAKPGEIVPVVIKDIDPQKRRISLSIKDAEGDPWIDVPEKFKVGQRVLGVVEKREKFGYFVSLDPGITGLLPLSKIKGASKPSQYEKLQEGEKITVVIEEIHPQERKMTLAPGDSAEEGDWQNFAKKEEQSSGIFGQKLYKAMEKMKKENQ